MRQAGSMLNDNIELAADASELAAFLYRWREKEPSEYQRMVRTIQI